MTDKDKTQAGERERAERMAHEIMNWAKGDTPLDELAEQHLAIIVMDHLEAARREERKRCAEKLVEAARQIAKKMWAPGQPNAEEIEQILNDTFNSGELRKSALEER